MIGKILQTSFLELVQQRQSVRKFMDRPVEREKIITCIEAARLAPSAENVQPWRFLVLDDPQVISRFASEAFSGVYRFTRWAAQAPVIVMLLAELDVLANRIGKEIQGTHYYLLDIGIAGEHLVLQAQELGLGSCWIGWFSARKAARVMNITGKYKVTALLALGYPQHLKKKNKVKKPLEELLFFNEFKK